VAKVPHSEPWKTGKDARYQYYPYGDTSGEKKDAPSALHISIVPNVNLPKVKFHYKTNTFWYTNAWQSLHEQFNKYGKDEYP
jgi:hypothetical protein